MPTNFTVTSTTLRPNFLRTHLVIPVGAGLVVLALFAWFDVDRRLADALFYDSAMQQWIGRHSYLANELLHTGGRNLMRLVGLLAIIGWALSFRVDSLRARRRELGYFALCMALVPLTVGALKELTNVDCPWDLQDYGGDRPYVELLADRPDNLPRAACFPGAHSSSAFALFALYFLWMTTHPARARAALTGVLLIGTAFSIAQQSRGAHFFSHDLVSALIAWVMCLALYLRFSKTQSTVVRNAQLVVVALICLFIGSDRAAAAESTARSWSLGARNDPIEQKRPADVPDDSTLEAAGAKIGKVIIRPLDVFDTGRSDEDNWLFRTANRLHINTRDSTVADRLLFREGDAYIGRLLEESERLLRDTRYLYDAAVRPIRYADGVVDVEVVTRDVWTLNPGVSFGRKGGKSTSGIELEELNLLGRGSQLNFKQLNEVDRDITSARFVDRQLGSTWWALELEHSDFSDGGAERLVLEHPFYALDTRWAGGVSVYDTDRIDSRYDLSKRVGEYAVDDRYRSAWFGYSKGLQGNLVTRWSFGVTSDDRNFSAVPDSTLNTLVPRDRKLVYPWIGVEWQENDFRAVRNRDQIERTEDFQYGWSAGMRLGYSTTGLDADRNAVMFASHAGKGYDLGRDRSLLLAASLEGRYEDGRFTDTLLSTSARYYHRQSDRRLFFASLAVDAGERLDADRELMLGGDTGLRGYPLRYQGGQGRWLLTLEQRAFTNWYPFRLVHVGAAAFVDVGGTWGRDPFASNKHEILGDVGVGLRLGNSRSALGNVLHIDLAFPVNGDKSLNNMQVIVETKRSF